MTFDSQSFLSRVARRLILEFDDAGQAGTPGLIGNAREHPARQQFEKLLPGAVGVGTGLVIDSFQGASRQQDIVIYEKSLSPVFSVNDTPEATYFPCEGVVAVGEVKSQLGSAALETAFENVASVKRLLRRAEATKDLVGETVAFRHYGSPTGMSGTKEEQFDQRAKTTDQVFGFILCNKFAVRTETLFDRAIELWKQSEKFVAPNLIVSLNDGVLHPYDRSTNKLALSVHDGSSIAFLPGVDGFGSLLRLVNLMVRRGRTVEVGHYHRYFLPAGGATQTRFSLLSDL